MIDFLLKVFEESKDSTAVIWRKREYRYCELLDAVKSWQKKISEEDIPANAVVGIEADFSLESIALLLTLIEHLAIIVPLTKSVEKKKDEYREIAQVEFSISINDDGTSTFGKTGLVADHDLYDTLRNANHPGLVLFSSGSTGTSKAAIHDFAPLLEKFKIRRHSLRTITFLLFDHIGGINTLLYVLSNGGSAVAIEDRSPDAVCDAIQKYDVQLLPTSPTFINMILASEAYQRFDLSSLERVSYGTELMPESTLKRFHGIYPDVKLQQTYGLSEVGILRSKSKSSDSLWVKVGGEGFETRVVDGLLEIKAESAMLGYLNAPSPFTDDGWFMTGDEVEVDGEYLRFLGRKSEIINVGGEKVYPAEVESVIQAMDGISDVSVSGESHPLTGQMVVAEVMLKTDEKLTDLRKRIWHECAQTLQKFKIPQKIVISDQSFHSGRFKKMRRPESR